MIENLTQTFSKIPAKDRVEFYGFIATLLDSGLSLQNACGLVAGTLERQAEDILFGKGRILATAKLYRFTEGRLRQGFPLHSALEGRIPDAEAMMLMAGDQGSLKEGLNAAGRSAKAAANMRETFRKGLLYPLGLFALILVSMNWIGNNLLPTLVALKDLEDWTPAQQNFYWATRHISAWLPIVLAVIAGLTGFFVLINRYVVGEVREAIHGIPPLNVIRQVTSATLLTTVSSLVLAGESLRGALERMKNSSVSPYLVHYIENALANIRVGLAAKGPGKALASKLFTPWIIVKLELYSRGDANMFAHKMAEIAEDAQANAMSTIQGFSKLIGTFMLIIVASIIGFTVITMYSITGSLQAGAGM
ncbi:secretion system protein [Marinobacter subterrani]|uniref:secretion system protein n=1 Tax=Marinobacter subterrani TaxID=1658765 RepID=UPI00235354ED|nr:secretion system protein [Marinobacter subterrani]